jgi:hypothetical protein
MQTRRRPVAAGELRETARTSRRTWLQFGLAGACGVAFRPTKVSAGSDSAADSFGRAKRCLQVFLNGGPSQLDTWDMKPDAPAEIRGELQPIGTSVPGIQVSELFPRVAQQIDKVKIVRSVTHDASVHTTGVYTMLTGSLHATPQVDQTRTTAADHPHLGCITARGRAPLSSLPPFVSLPTLFQAPPVEGIWPGQNAGFLGCRFDPFVVSGDKLTAQFSAPAVELAPDLRPGRLQDRRSILAQLDANRSFAAARSELTNDLWDQAFSLLGSSGVREAADLAREPAAMHERYGRHLFGQGLLLARRLIESGVGFVTVYWIDPTPAGAGGGEWDSHGRLYWHMRNRLAAPADQAIAALISDLAERGLYDDTLLVVMSEFGRTPRFNPDAGRDHWPQAQSILLAGPSITAGAVHGSTDRYAAYPASDPVTPPDLGQSLLHLLGVPADLLLRDQQGRPVPASTGRVNERLLS